MPSLSNINIKIGDAEVIPSATIRNLGVVFDATMNMSNHITSICKTVNFLLWNLSRIRRFVTEDASSNAMRALVLSKIDYANAFCLDVEAKTLLSLTKTTKPCCPHYLPSSTPHSSSPLLNSLHWLPIDQRICFKVLLYIYKTLNDLAPPYLSDCLTIRVPTREGLRSNQDLTPL
ncbi:uncharacterized protein [Amphiura filiformis]|uniref:uncharacterized protein n=1 Tax=Amphiura filiformis TaxID=82378 RepID=UPI003B21AF4F